MWKRDESVKPAPAAQPSPGAGVSAAAQDPRMRVERDLANIGKLVVIKGELSGSQDLTIDGQVEGRIELRDNVLTIGANGKIRAEVFAKSVIVFGEVHGNVTASERVDIRDQGSIDGDIVSPRVAIAEGAHFRGSVDMQRKAVAGPSKADVKPVAAQPVVPQAAVPAPPPVGPPAGPRIGA